MQKKDIEKVLKTVKEKSPKRNFVQRVDLILNLSGIDMKKSDQLINSFVSLHYSRGKPTKVCALVGPELLAQAKDVCDLAISVDDFGKYQKSREAKKLAQEYDFFVAQATIMPKIATAFGKVFGPQGKMPNPKAGCVVPPNAQLKPLYERLQKTVRLRTLNDPIIQVGVGNESMKDEEIVDNVMVVYESLINTLPGGENRIRNSFLKVTMGKSYQVGGSSAKEESSEKKPAKGGEDKAAEKEEK